MMHLNQSTTNPEISSGSSIAASIYNYINITVIRYRKTKSYVRRAYLAITLCFFLIFCFQIVGIINARNDLDKLFECFSVLSFCGMGVFKLVSLFWNYESWNELLTLIVNVEEVQNQNKFMTKYEHEEDVTVIFISEHIKKYTNRFNIISTVMRRLYMISGVVFILSPFVEYVLSFLSDTPNNEWLHIIPGWAPIDRLGFVGYICNIIFEVVAALFCVSIHIAFDVTSVGIIIFISGQFCILKEFSETIGKVKENDNEYLLSEERDNRAHAAIIKCHTLHVLLTRSIHVLRNLLKQILGIYFYIATLTLCSVAVRANTDLSIVQLASLIQYLCATLIQLFLYCYLGDYLYNKSSVGMGEGPLVASYWGLSTKIRKELSILAIGMTTPARLYAGPFVYVDLPSFIQVLRTAYSYYAVIRK